MLDNDSIELKTLASIDSEVGRAFGCSGEINHHRHEETIPRLRRVGGQGPVFQSSTQFGGKRQDLENHGNVIINK